MSIQDGRVRRGWRLATAVTPNRLASAPPPQTATVLTPKLASPLATSPTAALVRLTFLPTFVPARPPRLRTLLLLPSSSTALRPPRLPLATATARRLPASRPLPRLLFRRAPTFRQASAAATPLATATRAPAGVLPLPVALPAVAVAASSATFLLALALGAMASTSSARRTPVSRRSCTARRVTVFTK